MKKTIASIVLAITLLLPAFSVFSSAAELPFKDVKKGKWYYSAVEKVFADGIMNGLKQDVFAPDEKMTRAQLVTIICRLSGDEINGLGQNLTFSDTKKTAWYSDYLGWAVREGVIAGYPDNTFKPNSPVTRAELAVVFARYFTSREIYLADAPLTDSFTDGAKIAKWAKESVETIRLCGIIAGDKAGNFNPSSSATRAEIAMMITRYLSAEKLPRVEYLMRHLSDYVPMEGRQYALRFSFTADISLAGFTSRLFGYLPVTKEDCELIMDEEQIADLKDKWQYHEFGDKIIVSMKLGLRDKVTGETSGIRTVLFALSKIEEHTFIDPDEFDPEIESGIYEEMIEKSAAHPGNTARLYRALRKGADSGSLTAVYLGGSITAGATASPDGCFARAVSNWLELHVAPEVNYVNAGIGGTNSMLGNARLERHVTSKDPDVVFVEFAVNDGGAMTYGVDLVPEAFESLVRTLLSDNDGPAVVFVYCYFGEASIPFMNSVAEKYGIPVVDVQAAVGCAVEKGAFDESKFTDDGCHPNSYGHMLMANIIDSFLAKALTDWDGLGEAEAAIVPLPEESVTAARFTNLKTVDAALLDVVSEGSFTFLEGKTDGFEHPAVESGAGGNEPFVFTVTGKNVFLLLDKERIVEVSVDGGPFEGRGTVMSSWIVPAFISDTDETHTIAIRSAEPFDPVTLLAVVYN